MAHKPQTLLDHFMTSMVEPVVLALKKQQGPSNNSALKAKISQMGGELMLEIHRLQEASTDITQTMDYLLQRVEDMEKGEDDDERTALVSPLLTSEESDVFVTDGMSITEMVFLNSCMQARRASPDLNELIEKKLERLGSPLILSSSPVSSSDDSSFLKGMPSRKRAKRSLEDTVQMLSKENSMSPPPPSTPRSHSQLPLPFVLPQMNIPFSGTAMMQRWLGSPFANPVYLNAMNVFQQHQPPKPSEEQLTALMKMSMHAARMMKNVSPPHQSFSGTDSDAEDVKIDIESDEGEIGVSPSPSMGDATENESSSSSSGPLTSPTSADADSVLEKPFICMHNNCGKRFANKFLLKKHMFIHTGLRPHTCPHCQKKFNRKDNLLRHKKTHNQNETSAGMLIPKNHFHPLPQLPPLHNLAQSLNHFHALKMSLENGATAVPSRS
ncbi:unnamed protein product [Caenorhabditis nigoni]